APASGAQAGRVRWETPCIGGILEPVQETLSDFAENPAMNAVPPLTRPAYQTAETPEEIRANLNDIRTRIDAACARAGRDPADVRLLPISKTVDEARIRMAYAAGCRLLGENKVQEAYGKWEAMADLTDLHWAVIGHLQTNKAKFVARFAQEFQALDNLRVAEALDRRLQEAGRSLDVFVQVNTSGEA